VRIKPEALQLIERYVVRFLLLGRLRTVLRITVRARSAIDLGLYTEGKWNAATERFRV